MKTPRKLALSVVFGTLNRLPFLERAVQSISRSVGDLQYEIIVVDGGSSDGTLAWLRDQTHYFGTDQVHVIAQAERTGAVAAFTAGFHAARGEYVAAFNDDAEYFGRPLKLAVELLRTDRSFGQIAIPFATQRVATVEEIVAGQHPAPEVALVGLPGLGKVPYANFGVISKELGDRLGWWGEFYHYAGDTHLSTSVWAAGLRVAPLEFEGNYIVHYEAQDDTRLPNVEAAHFSALWHGPDSPLRQYEKQKFRPLTTPSQIPSDFPLPQPSPMPRQVRAGPTVLLRYTGQRYGNQAFQRPGSVKRYVVGAADRNVLVEEADVEWLLQLREGSKILFERVKEPSG